MSDVTFFKPDDDKQWTEVSDIDTACEVTFGIDVQFLMYDDYDGANAYVSPTLIDRSPRPGLMVRCCLAAGSRSASGAARPPGVRL